MVTSVRITPLLSLKGCGRLAGGGRLGVVPLLLLRRLWETHLRWRIVSSECIVLRRVSIRLWLVWRSDLRRPVLLGNICMRRSSELWRTRGIGVHIVILTLVSWVTVRRRCLRYGIWLWWWWLVERVWLGRRTHWHRRAILLGLGVKNIWRWSRSCLWLKSLRRLDGSRVWLIRCLGWAERTTNVTIL
jgi:hypothetical protein